MSEKKYKVIKVTFEQDFLIEMIDEKRSIINGWTIKEIIKDWFKNHSFSSYHATRDSHCISGSRKYISSEVIDLKDLKK